MARRRSVKRSKAPVAAARPAKARRSSFPEVEQLVELMDRHGLLEVDWEKGADGSRRVRVSRYGSHAAPAAGHAASAHGHAVHLSTAPAHPNAAPSAERPVPPTPAMPANVHVFKSPMVGTFYRAPSPEGAPFVSVGDRIDEHTTVCIIEAMKVMNEITPDKPGEIVSIEVENGEAVEYGQPLFLIRPA